MEIILFAPATSKSVDSFSLHELMTKFCVEAKITHVCTKRVPIHSSMINSEHNVCVTTPPAQLVPHFFPSGEDSMLVKPPAEADVTY